MSENGEPECKQKEEMEERKMEVENSTVVTITSLAWKDLTTKQRVKRVLWNYTARPIWLLVLIYLFFCCLDFMQSAFKLIAGRTAGGVFRDHEIFNNPITAVMIGEMVTVFVQSSSTSTSVFVAMVGANLLRTQTAIFLVMGANIGTSITNSIVAFGQSRDREQFKRAFAGATVHDIFNLLTVLILLPLEWASGCLEKLSQLVVESFHIERFERGNFKLLKSATEPFTKYIIQVDANAIMKIALNQTEAKNSLVKIYCDEEELVKCKFMFMEVAGCWADWVIGLILLILSLVLIWACIIFIVKMLNIIFSGPIAAVFRKFLNNDLPGNSHWITGYVAILVGAILTIAANSSSILTSTLTPLAGADLLSTERMYTLTVGANLGTTFTAILSALAQEGSTLSDSLQVALCHLFFNLAGMLLWYPVPFMRKCPISLATKLGNTAGKYRWSAVFYLIFTFLAIPAAIFGLGLAGSWTCGAVLLPITIFILIIIIINKIQKHKSDFLPRRLQNWEFLPRCFRSLEPIDNLFTDIRGQFNCRIIVGKVDTETDLEMQQRDD